ncbi:hypothetical protein [Chromohalobacter sp. 296-RDG]|uniref:hypothetical protein n=1 Tax=Chromohalobacter sp. 296-RDG TaxID=2994062 RepID=UPI0024693C44|nr:hypothetical protein [Chromohalobacter sp. 296-RDG]
MDSKDFRWVYDCGTVSSASLLDTQIKDLTRKTKNKRVDIAFISHFDKDHISGLVKLINTMEVGAIVLPYLPLWQRLLIAFEENRGVNSSLTQFLISPTRYVEKKSPENIPILIYVQSGSESGRNADMKTIPQHMEENFSLPVEADIAPIEDEDLEGIRNSAYILPPGSPIKINKTCELIPYNDSELTIPPGKRFKKEVEKLKSKLLSSPSQETLLYIKNNYDKTFGSNSRKRNVISLFLYIGPLKRELLKRRIISIGPIFSCISCRNNCWRTNINKPSILYTGDGYLHTTEKQDALLADTLGKERVDSIGFFQVMHHGAKKNWKHVLSSRINPLYSIFCSDPKRKKPGHPNPEVVKDFLPYSPIQVDKDRGFTARLH